MSGWLLATFLIISWLTWCRNHIKLAYPDRNQVACEAKSFHRRVHPDSSAPKVDPRGPVIPAGYRILPILLKTAEFFRKVTSGSNYSPWWIHQPTALPVSYMAPMKFFHKVWKIIPSHPKSKSSNQKKYPIQHLPSLNKKYLLTSPNP